MMNFQAGDYLIIGLYAAIVLYTGFVVARREKKGEGAEEFILAGRTITLPLFVGTLVATWYGNILGVGEFVFTSGVVAWVCFGLPYYVAAGVFAWFIAGRIRDSEALTIPDQMSRGYGPGAGMTASVIVLIITIPAAYILMLGALVKMFTGWSLAASIIVGALISLAYLFTGGFRADVLTNSVQFVLMFLGFGALLFFSMQQFGPAGLMLDQLPEQHLEFFGGESWQYVLSWYIISLQTFVDPSFHQRCAAAKSASTARRGIIISILFWMVFDSLTLLTGLYAKAYIDVSSPLMAYPALGEAVLPVAWKGLFVTALLAAVMSTLDSYAFISAATIGHDILRPLRKNARPESLTRIGLVITSIFGVALAIILPSAVDIIYKTASIAVPGLLIPLTFSFSRRWHLGARHAGIIMYSASGASAIWTLGQIYSENIAGGIALFDMFEPMLPGIAISMVLGAIWIRKR